MRFIRPNQVLAGYGLAATVLCAYVTAGSGFPSVIVLMTIFFFESIMFPTIFALAVLVDYILSLFYYSSTLYII